MRRSSVRSRLLAPLKNPFKPLILLGFVDVSSLRFDSWSFIPYCRQIPQNSVNFMAGFWQVFAEPFIHAVFVNYSAFERFQKPAMDLWQVFGLGERSINECRGFAG